MDSKPLSLAMASILGLPPSRLILSGCVIIILLLAHQVISNCCFISHGVEINSATLIIRDGTTALNSDIDYDFSQAALTALDNGVSLPLNVELVVKTRREWIWDRTEWHALLSYQIRYLALSKSYEVINELSGYATQFCQSWNCNQRTGKDSCDAGSKQRVSITKPAMYALHAGNSGSRKTAITIASNCLYETGLVSLKSMETMAANKLNIPMRFIVALALVLILVSLHLMSTATQNSAEIGSHFSALVVINSLALVSLLFLVGVNVYWLIRQVRQREAGSRLTARMISVFMLLALAPSALVFFYSINFLHQSIDSWFDVQVDRAMEDALELSQASLDERMRSQLKLTRRMADQLAVIHENLATVELGGLREWSEATELMLISEQKRVLAYSSTFPELFFPGLPTENVLSRVRQGEDYVGLDPVLG